MRRHLKKWPKLTNVALPLWDTKEYAGKKPKKFCNCSTQQDWKVFQPSRRRERRVNYDRISEIVYNCPSKQQPVEKAEMGDNDDNDDDETKVGLKDDEYE